MSRKVLLVSLLVLALSLSAAAAFAASPDNATTATTVIDPTTGVSLWSYKDSYDTTAKTEGGYAAFDSGTLYTTNPHGGYDSTTNKCKVCHAVHRAEGAYFLLRADTQDDACSYCHIGGNAHSRKIVYDFAGTIYPTNGHTIGASSVIPDSSVYQWLEDKELKTVDADGNEVTATVEIRRYYERRNKMFRFARHHGQSAAGTQNNRGGYGRIGPLALRCMNCHQPHNALDMIWKPAGLSLGTYTSGYNESQKIWDRTGYKLLRGSPSGSIWPSTATTVVSAADGFPASLTAWDVQIGREPVWPVGSNTGIGRNLIIRVPEDATLSPSNTGLNDWSTTGSTIWTDWPETAEHEFHGGVYRDPSVNSPVSLSFWCADCHNLNVGYWTEAEGADPMLFGFHQHTDRTHPAPYTGAYNGPAQCYSCHRNDRPIYSGTADDHGFTYTASAYTADAGDGKPRGIYRTSSASCEQCHFGTASYFDTMRAAETTAVAGLAWYDFPHSGNSDDIKMLGNWTTYESTPAAFDARGTVTTFGVTATKTTITSTNLDAVCKRCHPGIGVTH